MQVKMLSSRHMWWLACCKCCDDWYAGLVQACCKCCYDWYAWLWRLVQVWWKYCGRETATWLCWMLSCWPSVSTHTSGRARTMSPNSSPALVSNDTKLYTTGTLLISTQQQLRVRYVMLMRYTNLRFIIIIIIIILCGAIFQSACAMAVLICHFSVIFSY